MQYKQIVIFSIKEFNQNKEKEGKLPQEGEVINVTIYCPSVVLQHYVAVGYK